MYDEVFRKMWQIVFFMSSSCVSMLAAWLNRLPGELVAEHGNSLQVISHH